MDADGEHPIKSINKIYNYCVNKNADLVIGSRSRYNRISEFILSFLFQKFYKIYDPISGFKIYKSKVLNSIIKNNKIGNFFLVDLLFFFLKRKFLVKNFNILSSKKTRPTKLKGFFKTNLKILLCLKFILK